MITGIVFIAGIVRGCIGFGFSALVVASTSFWLDVKYVVMMVIVLEVIASLSMLRYIRDEINYRLFLSLSISGVVTSFLGVWLLARMDPTIHQLLLSAYLGTITLAILFGFKFKKPLNNMRLYIAGAIAGFYNGFAGIGGIMVAATLTSSGVQIKRIRATMVVYFFLVETAFFVSAAITGIFTQKAFFTAILLSIPMILGIQLGAKLFTSLSEDTLRKSVLATLLILSVTGLLKTFL